MSTVANRTYTHPGLQRIDECIGDYSLIGVAHEIAGRTPFPDTYIDHVVESCRACNLDLWRNRGVKCLVGEASAQLVWI